MFRSLPSRLARREMLSHKGRSLLIVVMIAIPVAAMVALSIVIASMQYTPEGAARTQLGRADYALVPLDGADGVCTQLRPMEPRCDEPKGSGADWRPVPLAQVAPPNAPTEAVSQVIVEVEGTAVTLPIVAVDATQPLLAGRWAADFNPGPNEVLVDRSFMERFDVRVGGRIIVQGHEYEISGRVRFSGTLRDVGAGVRGVVVVAPGHPIAPQTPQRVFVSGADLDEPRIAELNRQGVGVLDLTRSDYVPYRDDSIQFSASAMLAAAGVLASVVTGSVAASAFAIGIRQQRRMLALLASVGAPGRTLRWVVVRSGMLLGAIGSLVGVGLGLASGCGLVWLGERNEWLSVSGLTIWWLALAVFAMVGFVAAVIAVRLPGRSVGRVDVLAAVQEAGAVSRRAGRPWVALGLLVLSLVATVGVSSWVGASEQASAGYLGPSPYQTGAIAGTVLACFAMIAGVGWLVDRLAAAGSRMSLSWRLAMRDQARAKGRSVATVVAAASLIAIFMTTLAAVGAWGQSAVERTQRRVPPGYARLYVGNADARLAAQAVSRVVPVRAEYVPMRPQECRGGGSSCSRGWRPAPNPRCAWRDIDPPPSCQAPTEWVVASGDAIEFFLGRSDAAASATLRGGGALVFWPTLVTDGRIQFVADEGLDTVTLDAPGLELEARPGVPILVGESLAKRMSSVELVAGSPWLRLDRDPTPSELARISRELERLGAHGLEANVPPVHFGLAVYPWLALGALIAVGAVAVVGVSLSLVDGREARAAIAAVGASGRTERRIAVVSAFGVTLLAALLGAVVGLGPTLLAMAVSEGRFPMAVPWGWVAVIVFGVPVLVAVVAAIFVRPTRPRVVRID